MQKKSKTDTANKLFFNATTHIALNQMVVFLHLSFFNSFILHEECFKNAFTSNAASSIGSMRCGHFFAPSIYKTPKRGKIITQNGNLTIN